MPALATVRLKVPGKNRVIKVNAHDHQIHQFGKYAGWLIVGDARGDATAKEAEFHARQSEIEQIRRNSERSPASKDPERDYERRKITTPVGGGEATLDQPAPTTDRATGAATSPAASATAIEGQTASGGQTEERTVDRSGDFAQEGGGNDGPGVDTNGVPLHWRDWRAEKKWLVTAGIVKKVTGIKPQNKKHAEALMLPYENGDRTPGEPLPTEAGPTAGGSAAAGGEGDA